MQRITIPAYFETNKSNADKISGKESKDSDFNIRATRINRDLIISYYCRHDDDDKPSGSLIETCSGSFRTPLSPEEIDNLIDTIDTDDFILELNKSGLSNLSDLIPGTFDDEINNMLNPNDKKPDK